MTDVPSGTRPFDIREAFAGKSDQLRTVMTTASNIVSHGPTIGDGSEDGWVKMLTEFLPTRYGVTKAFVVDSHGHRGLQCDVVIHDRHFTPLFWKIGGAMFLPAESVYAVLEVKQRMDLGNIREASAKVASVRGLHRTTQSIVHAGGLIANPKPPPQILGGILAGHSGWRPPFGKRLRMALDGLDEHHRLDLGCGLKHGAFEFPEDVTATDSLIVAEADVGLAFFAMRLLARLQAMGTVPAMDIDAYTAVLSEGRPILRA